MDRERFIRVLGADPEKWAKCYTLTPATVECYSCAAPRTTSIPFFAGQLRGLIAPTCPCGDDRGPYCVTHVEPSESIDELLGKLFPAPKPRCKRMKKARLRLVTP